ncbi:MAG: mucoidy inhibitor MuiA family protein [Gammaproteobacteria bacterium]|nr:mucoidy inhibitor MuiA family protein [Gammaproteobacteria bacterium]
MNTPPLLLCLLLALPVATPAATLTPARNAIDAVTVFLDRAEVTRLLDVELPAGAHTIEVPGLPAQLIEPSLRAAGQGPQGLRIGSVETRRLFGSEAAQEQERTLRAELQTLTERKAQLEGKVQALDTQAAFIQRLATLPGEEQKEGNRLFTPEKWPAAWQAIGQGMAETNAARLTLQQEGRTLTRQIQQLEERLRQIQTGRRDTLTALLHIESASGGSARFTLSYQLPNATWSPSYDAQLATEQGTLELTQRASVRQASGEAWEGVALSVSTARPSAGVVMPSLTPWWIDFSRPPLPAARMRLEKSQRADEMIAGAMAPDTTLPAEAEEVVAAVQATEFSVRYRIPGRVSVPADNSRQRFVLGKQQFSSRLAARATPKRDPRAFLYAEFDYSGESPLLAGSWQLQRDGIYVGTAEQAVVRPGEAMALPFGPDEAIKVEHQLLKDERGTQGLLKREQRVERRYRITLTNGHQRAIPITVYDQLPVARNETINVALSDDSTPPNATNVDERSGVISWQQALAPKKPWQIDFGYDISFPREKEIPGF